MLLISHQLHFLDDLIYLSGAAKNQLGDIGLRKSQAYGLLAVFWLRTIHLRQLLNL